MQDAKNLKEYRSNLRVAMGDDFMRTAVDQFAVAYREARERAFDGFDTETMIDRVAQLKDDAIEHLDLLFERFRDVAREKGIHVHLAKDAQHANEIISTIASMGNVKQVIKSKSMTAEETLLNHYLEAKGLEVTETDLGEFIIQLRNEGPSHMVLPAIHLSRFQVADLFADVTGKDQAADIEQLVKVARRELRRRFIEADMAVTGANVAVADTGTIGLITNEGNARLATTLPRIHVALVGLEKLVPKLADALSILRVLPRNATGQQITSYVTWITGAHPWGGPGDDGRQNHVVFLDNGRRDLAKDKTFAQVLRCVRCGACANVCPIYRMVGGHQYGHIYIGAIGLILTYFFHGRHNARNLVQNCINCGACKSICAAGIDLPALIKGVHARILEEEGHPVKSTLLSKVLRNRRLFHGILRTASVAQTPMTGGGPYLRHLPQIFAADHQFRRLPAIADQPFRDQWPSIAPTVRNPKYRVALFAGCVQDFVYPEQLVAAVKVMASHQVAVEFPMDQSCCGLPVQMMGETKAARDVAVQNVLGVNADRYDYVITLCASCASHLVHAYPEMLADRPTLALNARRFADRVLTLSQFLIHVLGVTADKKSMPGVITTYHAPCHLCRGIGERQAPKDLIRASGRQFVMAKEEETCCGFGGTYSAKFPRISAEILEKKLADIVDTGAEELVTECPGCIMQLRGGVEAKGLPVAVRHLSEMVADALPSDETPKKD